MALSTISFSGFAKPPDFNILIPISYSVIDAPCNSNMLIAKIADALLKKGTKHHADAWDCK
jgi:hypothetical protein